MRGSEITLEEERSARKDGGGGKRRASEEVPLLPAFRAVGSIRPTKAAVRTPFPPPSLEKAVGKGCGWKRKHDDLPRARDVDYPLLLPLLFQSPLKAERETWERFILSSRRFISCMRHQSAVRGCSGRSAHVQPCGWIIAELRVPVKPTGAPSVILLRFVLDTGSALRTSFCCN